MRWLVWTLALAACTPIWLKMQGQDGAPMFVNFSKGSYCRRPTQSGYSYTSYPTQLSDDLAPGEKLHRVMCDDFADDDYYETIYARIPEKGYDALDAAIMIVTCVGHGPCDATEGTGYGGRGPYRFSVSRSADLVHWAQQTSIDDVKRWIAPLREPSEVKEAFAQRFEACRRQLVNAVLSLDKRRQKVYVRTIEETRHRRKADEAALAPLAARWEELKPEVDRALLDHKVTVELRARAIALRDEYVDACIDRLRPPLFCLTGPGARAITERLVRLSVELKDRVHAEAEMATVRFGPDQSDLKVEIRIAVSRAMKEETRRHREWSEAKALGTDEGVLAAKYGDPPPVDLSQHGNDAGVEPPKRPELDDKLYQAGGDAQSVRIAVKRVELRAKRALLWYGPNERDTIDVPVVEAESIREGEIVQAVIDYKTRKGYVLEVFPEGSSTRDEAIQLRAWRRAAK